MSSNSEQMLSVGSQCSHESCSLIDFLPFKCQHCAHSFCQDHFMVSTHKCPAYDETKFNRVAPNCPFCNVVLSIPRGQDPNDVMETHFMVDCAVVTGVKAKAKTTPVCARPKCGKTLFSPIRCTKCTRDFCPSHRFPGDGHTCQPVAAVQQIRAGGATMNSRLLDLNKQASAASSAAVTAVKSMAANVQAKPAPVKPKSSPAPSPATTSTGKSTSSVPNLFSKTDRSPPSSPALPILNEPETPNKPEPVIRMSFVPPPIFATA